MKHFFSAALLLLSAMVLHAQAPQSVNYQGVARNAAGAPYANQTLAVRLSVRANAPNGTVEYAETRNITTNALGLFNVQIGSAGATNIQGNFSSINWPEGTRFLQTELSVNSQPFVNIGSTQMMSVPYAMHSMQARQLVLPYDTSVNSNNGAAFRMENTSAGAFPSILGESVNGDGITGTSEKKSGVSGYSKTAGVGGITGANSAVGGYGVHGYTPGASTSGAGVYGSSLNANGVLGETAFGYGVYGSASGASGTAVRAYANQGWGVYSTTSTGTALRALATGSNGVAGYFGQSNTNGLALSIQGNVKIAGGNTNPGTGKVLTSDAAGNASWQTLPTVAAPPKVAFKLKDVFPGGLNNYSEGNLFKVWFNTEEYDYGNTVSIGNTTANSVFTAPYTGVYHFDASVGTLRDGITAFIDLIKQNSAGQTTVLKVGAYAETLMDNPDNIGQRQNYSVSTDTRLDAGDKVYVRFRWWNGHVSESEYTGVAASQGSSSYINVTQFSGHMVFAE